ncbi:hypothetical protein GN956_G6135 [Arapaima gigas]
MSFASRFLPAPRIYTLAAIKGKRPNNQAESSLMSHQLGADKLKKLFTDILLLVSVFVCACFNQTGIGGDGRMS